MLNRLSSGQLDVSGTRAALQTLVGQPHRPQAGEVGGLAAQLASRAGVLGESIAAAATLADDAFLAESPAFASESPATEHDDHDDSPLVVPAESGTLRFSLGTVAAPQRDDMPALPTLHGPALILGRGPMAEALAEAVLAAGQDAFLLEADDEAEAETQLEEIWTEAFTPHVFLATPHDPDRMEPLAAAVWQNRREPALKVPFRVCQLWMTKAIDEGRMERCSVVALASLGGQFGFDGRAESIEGGGIGALVKAMLIEAWMRGARTTPMKVIDVAPGSEPAAVAAAAMRELAVPSYDMELATDGRERRAVQAIARPLRQAQQPKRAITRGGTWIVSGGGRGITALCAKELAARHDLKLWLLGTAPQPHVTPEQREAYQTEAGALRRRTMQAAATAGENGVEAWRDLEKALEIDITLQAMAAAGVQAKYRSVDISDVEGVAAILEEVRRTDGAIHGVLHGAGAGQDARFDRKRPDKVEKCIRAKVDGALALAAATEHDDLEWFVGFGSISGRFGANGHTDYSLANDMLAKTVGKLGQERPATAAVTFHWHAWGDVGMATKPEAKLALEMIDMEFMPAAEGLAHFLAELEHGGHEPEALITDRRYYRKFFPADRVADGGGDESLPLLGDDASRLRLDPAADRFLTEHRVGDVPTLPIVVAIEAMAQAARAAAGHEAVREARDVIAKQALKFAADDPTAASLDVSLTEAGLAVSLRADIRRRDGRLVAEDREFFTGVFETSPALRCERAARPSEAELAALDWHEMTYPDAPTAAPIYHGPALQRLLRVAGRGEGETAELLGLIAGPANVELFGEQRPGRGWSTVPAVADACLYAAAVFAHSQSGRASLPVSFDRLAFGRPSDPGEPCLVTVRMTSSDDRGASLAWTLQGLNGDILLAAKGYRLAWIG